jgi:hypothetical protein
MDDALAWAASKKLRTVAADLSGTKSYTEIDWQIPRMVVFGSEAHGLDEDDLKKIDERIVIPMEKDVETVRFQPYRLFNSPKHDTTDPRLSCVACHDPHEKTQRDPAFYDSKCFACHLATGKDSKTSMRSAAACPVSRQNCVSCHMPKTDVPEMHFKFTDHWIRIVKPDKQ